MCFCLCLGHDTVCCLVNCIKYSGLNVQKDKWNVMMLNFLQTLTWTKSRSLSDAGHSSTVRCSQLFNKANNTNLGTKKKSFSTLLFPFLLHLNVILLKMWLHYSLCLMLCCWLTPFAQEASGCNCCMCRICRPSTVSESSSWLEGNLGGVVPPHPGFPALLLQLQGAKFLLPTFLAVPQLLAVVVHTHAVGPHHVQVFVALHRQLLRRQPWVPVSRQLRLRRSGLAEEPCYHGSGRDHPPVVRDELEAGGVEAVVGDDVKAVSGQHLAVGVLVAGAGVEACIGLLQPLNQQPPLHVDCAVVVTLTELGRSQRVNTKLNSGQWSEFTCFQATSKDLNWQHLCLTAGVIRSLSLLSASEPLDVNHHHHHHHLSAADVSHLSALVCLTERLLLPLWSVRVLLCPPELGLRRESNALQEGGVSLHAVHQLQLHWLRVWGKERKRERKKPWHGLYALSC